jgi:hypothetical protein
MSDSFMSADELNRMLNSVEDDSSDKSLPFEVTESCWYISREKFLKILRVVDSFPAKSSGFFAIWRDGNILRFHSNNKDSFMDCSLPLLNKDAYQTKQVYFVNSDILESFVNSFTKFVFVFDASGTISYRSPYARYKLETYKMDLAAVKMSAEDGLVYSPFPILADQVRILNTLYSFSTKLSDNKIRFMPDFCDAYYTLYMYTISSFDKKQAAAFILRRIDLPMIYEVYYKTLTYALTDTRVYIKFPLGVVSFPRFTYDSNAFLYPETFAHGDIFGDFQMDVRLLRKALKLCSILNCSSISFSCVEDKVYLSNDKGARFMIGSGKLSKDFTLEISLFSKIVSAINSDEIFIRTLVSDYGVDFVLEHSMKERFSISRSLQVASEAVESLDKPASVDAPFSVPDIQSPFDLPDLN